MRYLSTRDKSLKFKAQDAIVRGLSRDGGLFTPDRLPELENIDELLDMNYSQRAAALMGLYLEDFSKEELLAYAEKAYGADKFDAPEVTPITSIDASTHFLELWHGPTSAFKDMALQMLPYLLTASLEKTGESKTAYILVATSGDTGKAALEGFKDVDGTKIMVFYPKDGVSKVQELQMVSQEGENVGVCAVEGNFDDAQTGVKRIFSDETMRERLEEKGIFLSSANSINWGRVLPQIVYYVSVYCDLINKKAIKKGDEINVCVPTGNFGNILSAYYAKCMGIPIKKLICASNSNNVLTDFFDTGNYDKRRQFYCTSSPSMDILISSNLERLLFHLSGNNDSELKDYMDLLDGRGSYAVTGELRKELSKLFFAAYCDDQRTAAAIKEVFDSHSYLIDTHTAVAYDVLKQYRETTGDKTPCVVVSTASPYKFCESVLTALGVKEIRSGTEAIDQLSELTKTKAPAPLAELKNKSPRFSGWTTKEKMPETVLGSLE